MAEDTPYVNAELEEETTGAGIEVMNKTAIEWCDYTWNPVTGCLNNCEYCYARRIANRFQGTKAWPYGFEPTLHIGRFDEPGKLKKPSRIFVCSMGELFGSWLDRAQLPTPIPAILDVVKTNPQHTFQFLTKCPENLAKWNPWPDNTWVGVTATNTYQFLEAIYGLTMVEAKIRFISFEPLHEYIPVAGVINFLDEVIIGAETGNRKGKPPLEKVHECAREIIKAADSVGVPVFLKDNLQWPEVRREWPGANTAKEAG